MIDLLVILFIALQLADYVTTINGIKLGYSEGNPLLAKLFRRTRPEVSLAVVKLTLCLAVLAAAFFGALHLYVISAMCAAYLAVVGNNIYRVRGDMQ